MVKRVDSIYLDTGGRMTLFRLDASIRVEGSHSRALADIVEQEWTAGHPGDAVIRRHVGTEPVPSTAWPLAVQALMAPADEERTPAQLEAVALAAREADAILSADVALFAVPLYNFGVSQHFKTWVDLVITDPRMAGETPATAGIPAVLAVVRGGFYGAGSPREGWDYATGWMRRILSEVWKFDLEVVEEEFALVGVNPALDQFKDMALELRAKAEQTARERGRNLAAKRPVPEVRSA
jgi:FMN-dependent NADH-azoreductase